MVKRRKLMEAQERAGARSLLPLVAIGGGLAAAPVAALELGDLTVQSSLGQPLRASIAYALQPNEMLTSTCVSVSAGRSTGGLPAIGPHSVTITERAILINGSAPIREPMLGTRVTINCPYTPNLSREYMLFVDPAGLADTSKPFAPVATAPVARPQIEPRPQPQRVTAQSRPAVNTPIGQASRYQVQPGETLSAIVSRIENRSMSLWPAVDAVFAANPDAFIGNDPNKLKAGSWLTIPSFDGTAPVVAAPASVAAVSETAPSVAVPVVAEVADSSADTASSADQASDYDPAAFDETADAQAAAITDTTADLKPGDVVPDSLLQEPVATIAIPDTELEGPQTASTSPNVPTAIVSTRAQSDSTSLLLWLAGGGLAIIAALVVFGRRARRRFGPAPLAPAVAGPAMAGHDAAAEDYDLDDDSPTEENLALDEQSLALDADLEIGTGLDQGVEVDVAQDFGFAATTNLDIELPFEPEAPAADRDTDVIAPMKIDADSILESEMLPEDDDYDMSIIMDATKMPQPEEVTERDLQAVAVDADDETAADGSFTVEQEVDFDTLEKDYEQELSATQALNMEIERAAAELAKDLDASVDDESTSALPRASRMEPDATAELPAVDTEKTVEFEASYDPNDTNAVTVNMSSEDKTAEMSVANDDETVEMDIESGKVDTRKS